MKFIHYKNNSLFFENCSAYSLAKNNKTPFYCYSKAKIIKNFTNFSKIFSKISPLICFAVKSNNNIFLLQELKKLGAGADVVSAGELLRVLKAGINPKKIVFSGVGKTEDELRIAIQKKILLINIESESEATLVNNLSKKLSKKTSIGIRLNPNVDSNTHKKISTGRNQDKFGMLDKDFFQLVRKIKNMQNLKLEGISVHIGSQILNVNPFRKTLLILNKLISSAKINLKFIDLGGGMGIPYSQKQKELNLKKYANEVKKFIKNKKIKIIFEPGRFIIGNTSVLVSKIIYIKDSNNKKFIILDAGMNNLMRPALYDSIHEIIPVKKSNNRIKGNLEFVGPICESSDKFLSKKNFAQIKEGDYVVFKNTGAYGMSMSSNYNLRPTIAEIMVNGSKYKIIRKRQSLESLVNN